MNNHNSDGKYFVGMLYFGFFLFFTVLNYINGISYVLLLSRMYLFIFSETADTLYLAKTPLSCIRATLLQPVWFAAQYKLPRSVFEFDEKVWPTNRVHVAFSLLTWTIYNPLWFETGECVAMQSQKINHKDYRLWLVLSGEV